MIPVLMYHNIAKESNDLYTVSLTEFEKHMEWLYSHGYRTLTPGEFSRLNQQDTSLNDKLIMLTFDDGDIGNYTYAYPLLCKYGFKAAFFVIAASIGSSGKMGWQELLEVSRNGIVIGSHGLTHNLLATLALEEIRHELKASKQIIEKEIGLAVDFVSTPEGSWNRLVKKLAKEVGYKFMFISDAGYNGFSTDPFLLRRFVIRTDYAMSEFKRIVEKDNSFLIRKKVEQFTQSTFRNFLGRENYKKFKKDLIGIKRESKR